MSARDMRQGSGDRSVEDRFGSRVTMAVPDSEVLHAIIAHRTHIELEALVVGAEGKRLLERYELWGACTVEPLSPWA